MTESLLKEIMTENFSNLDRDLDTQVHEANRQSPNFNSTEQQWSKDSLQFPGSPKQSEIKQLNFDNGKTLSCS